jgi:hypothetical protein
MAVWGIGSPGTEPMGVAIIGRMAHSACVHIIETGIIIHHSLVVSQPHA